MHKTSGCTVFFSFNLSLFIYAVFSGCGQKVCNRAAVTAIFVPSLTYRP